VLQALKRSSGAGSDRNRASRDGADSTLDPREAGAEFQEAMSAQLHDALLAARQAQALLQVCVCVCVCVCVRKRVCVTDVLSDCSNSVIPSA
jgi:hypothetical protein